MGYYLLSQELEDGRRAYGISVEYGEEQDTLLDLTGSMEQAGTLLEKLARGGVTPVTLRDVVEDWLLA